MKINVFKTLRLASMAAVGLAGIFLILAVFFGFRGNKDLQNFVKSPGAVEKYTEAKGQRDTNKENEISPLVKEAADFAKYINPPPPPPPAPSEITKTAEPPKPKYVAPKFNLVGTSFSEKPELCRALIDEPGVGFRWVKQSTQIEHLVVEEIKDGVVVCKDGDRSVEIVVEKPPERSLVKGKGVQIADMEQQPSQPIMAANTITSPNPPAGGVKSRPAGGLIMPATNPTSSVRRRPPPGRADPERKAMMEKLVKGLTDPNGGSNKTAMMHKIAESMKVQNSEANGLKKLGEHLKENQAVKERKPDTSPADNTAASVSPKE